MTDSQQSRALRPRSVHSQEYRVMAQMLRDARINAGLTQRAVAARLGKPPSYAHKVESAEREINVIELMSYCAALNLSFCDFAEELDAAISSLLTQPIKSKQ